MKRTNLALAIIAISLIALSSCKKDDLVASPNAANSNISNAETATEGVVYTMDNAVAGNNVIVLRRDANGTLASATTFPTGGAGTGAGLGSQGAIVQSDHRLFVCNAGSNNITVFEINGQSLKKIDRTISHGTTPISLTVNGDLLYVLNAGETGNISGFRIGADGHLTYINKSKRGLSSDTSQPAQVEFNKAGTQLVVTEKATNRILTYQLTSNGLTGDMVTHPSAGTTPFGFEFGKHNTLIVSDAFGGAPNGSALSSYKLTNAGNFKLVTGPVASHQTSACWVAITGDGNYCYTTNAVSNSISGYKVADDGSISLLDANGVTAVTGASPVDMAMSRDSKYLYSLNSADGSVSAFKIANNGGLVSLGVTGGIPLGASGLAAR
jgi:6-phosphogluconolactonase (cycloisomerase 2 family)